MKFYNSGYGIRSKDIVKDVYQFSPRETLSYDKAF